MKKLLNLLVLMMIISSCATTYVPTSVNVPTFSNKGEFQAKLLAGFNGGDLQLGFAPTKHLGLMMNFSAADDSEESTQFRRNTGEIGAGYWTNVNGRLVWEIFGGIGAGNLQGLFIDDLGTEYFEDDVSYSKVFIQPAVGWTTDILDVSLATRVSIIGMETSDVTPTIETIAYLEPALTLGLGFRWIKFQMQAGLSIPTQEQLPYTHTPIILNAGFAARIGKKFY